MLSADPAGRLWLLFCGVVFVLMGASLGLDAQTHARAARDWQRAAGASAQGGGLRRLTAVYRALGAVFAGVGLWLIVARVLLAPAVPAGAAGLSPGARRAAGAALLLLGAAMSALRLWERGKPKGPRFLQDVAPEGKPPLSRRAASWSGWALSLSFLLFGALLLSRR